MQSPFAFQHHPKQLEHPFLKLPAGQDFIVWWYGALLAGLHQGNVPRVVVWFRKLIDNSTLGGFERCDLALNFLGQFRIGSIWRDKVSTKQLQFSRRHLRVNYTRDHWHTTTSVADHWKENSNFLIAPERYDLEFRKADRSRLLQFDGPKGKVLIPCLEYLVRCYGRRQEINRVLCTYNWPEVVRRLHLDHPVEPVTDSWSINLPDIASEYDGYLLANLRYNNYTQCQAKAIQATIDSKFAENNNKALVFPDIGPWFEGKSELKVEGIELPNGNFLGLRVVGYSVPGSPPIVSARDHAPPSGTIDGEGNGGHRDGAPYRKTRHIPEHETSQAEESQPRDHFSEIIDFSDPTIELLGTPPPIKVVKGKPRERTRPGGSVSPTTTVSAPGDPSGSAKGIGEAQFTAVVALDSQGAVKDLWEGLQFLKSTNPDLLLGLGWYCAERKQFDEENLSYAYVELPEPNVEKKSVEDRKFQLWLKMSRSNQRRGILVIRIRSPEIVGYILELQREQTLVHIGEEGEEGDIQEEYKEESFRGLTVVPLADYALNDWLTGVLDKIVQNEGRMKKVRLPDGLSAKAYKRSSAKGVHLAGLATARLALEKLGIDLSLLSIRSKED